jgi:hypothetical protein
MNRPSPRPVPTFMPTLRPMPRHPRSVQINEMLTHPNAAARECTHSTGAPGAHVTLRVVPGDGSCFFHAVNATRALCGQPPLRRANLVGWMRANLSHDMATHEFDGLLRTLPGDFGVELLFKPFLEEGRRYTGHGRSMGDLILQHAIADPTRAADYAGRQIPRESMEEWVEEHLRIMALPNSWAGLREARRAPWPHLSTACIRGRVVLRASRDSGCIDHAAIRDPRQQPRGCQRPSWHWHRPTFGVLSESACLVLFDVGDGP